MRVRPVLARLVLLAALLWGGIATAQGAPAPRVTVYGDSVQASFGFAPQAVRHLAPGLRLRLEADVCRKLSAPGCLGGRPDSVVASANALGPALGDVVVVHVGYNDFAGGYDIRAAMAAFARGGVRAVVWVLLREARPGYAATNAHIRRTLAGATRRPGGPVVRLADWNAASAGQPGWFTADRIHLNGSGALGLARLLREEVLSVLAELGTSVDGRPIVLKPALVPLGATTQAIAGDGAVLWVRSRGRVRAIEGATGRPRPGALRLARDESLLGDGRGAWVADTGAETVRRAVPAAPRPRRGEAVSAPGGMPQLARTSRWLWSAAPCEGAGCADGASVEGRRVEGEPAVRYARTGGRILALAGDARSLWVLVEVARGRVQVQHRDPRSGNLRRAMAVRGAARGADLAAGRVGAWLATGDGRLLRITRDGRLRVVRRGVAAVAAGDDQVWVLGRDRRTVLNLHPGTGRERARARLARPLSDAMTLSAQHLWILAAGRTAVLRLARA